MQKKLFCSNAGVSDQLRECRYDHHEEFPISTNATVLDFSDPFPRSERSSCSDFFIPLNLRRRILLISQIMLNSTLSDPTPVIFPPFSQSLKDQLTMNSSMLIKAQSFELAIKFYV